MAERSTSTPLTDAGIALTLLTSVPLRARWPESGRTHAAGWFPLVGALIGSVGYGIIKLAEYAGALQRAQYAAAAFVIIVWAVMTRLLHWDGLADVADGYWGSEDRERRLEIMSDSSVGAFGAAAVALIVVFEVAGMGSFITRHQLPVLVVPIIARFAATAAAWLGRPAKGGGLGRSVMGRPSAVSAIACVATLAGVCALMWPGYSVVGMVLVGVGVFYALAIPHVLSLRFGGVTGDVMGASVVLTEALLFATFALAV
ncbi:MAG: adenosylcobinamide-GDP ribazoletransferase [Coriobacteriia bacterium]|nr:adenosylcobinamide-GDP ribazoletransferase [Coriobacteriia bacterium]